MKIILQDSQTGKTFRLIQESAETGATIVVVYKQYIKYIQTDAAKHNIVIPTPITWEEYVDQLGKKDDTIYLIDNLDLILKTYFKNIKTITLSNPWK